MKLRHAFFWRQQRYHTSNKRHFRCNQGTKFIVDTFANAEQYCKDQGSADRSSVPIIGEYRYDPYDPDKDKDGIENPVKSDYFCLNDFELEIERNHAMAQAWIVSESDLKKVRNPRIASG